MANVGGYYQVPAPVAPPPPPPPPPPPVPPAPAPVGGYQSYAQPASYAPAAGAGPVAPAAPGAPQQVASWDAWIPTSASDPYVAGMRTSAAAVAAVGGAAGSAANIRFANYAVWKSAGARASARAAAKSGSFFGVSSKMTKAMSMAKTSSQKSAFMSTIAKGPKNAGIGSALKFSFFNLGNVARAIGSSALVAVPIALITNFLDWKAGKVTTDQRNALIVADTAGYTATGAASTLIGGAIGSTFLGPMVGTVAGIGAGFLFGWVYEKYIRPRWGEWVHGAMYKTTAAPPPVQPQPIPSPPIIEAK